MSFDVLESGVVELGLEVTQWTVVQTLLVFGASAQLLHRLTRLDTCNTTSLQIKPPGQNKTITQDLARLTHCACFQLTLRERDRERE